MSPRAAAEPELIRILRLNGRDIPVVGALEASRLLGVSRQRFYQLRAEQEEFPEPVARLPRGAVWDRSAVERWAKKWDRKAGRPRKEP